MHENEPSQFVISANKIQETFKKGFYKAFLLLPKNEWIKLMKKHKTLKTNTKQGEKKFLFRNKNISREKAKPKK